MRGRIRHRRRGGGIGLAVSSVLALLVLASGARTEHAIAAPQLGDPLLPDTVVETDGRPRMVILSSPGSPVVALRLSIPVPESAPEAGAAKLLLRVGLARARGQAGMVGARVEGERTPRGIAYTVVGSSADLDYLGYLLRLAVAEPHVQDVEFRRLRADLVEDVRRSQETASGRIVRDLRGRLDPGTPPRDGTLGSLQALTPGMVLDLWRRTHQPSAMDLVVAGEVPIEVLLVSFHEMGAPADGDVPAPSGPVPEGDRIGTQVLRHWYGEARPLGDSRDPRNALAAVLAADALRGDALGDRSGFEAAVQLWEMDGRKAVAVFGAAYPASASAMRDRVRGVLEGARAAATPSAVQEAIIGLRRTLLVGARTPGGRVDLVGRHLEETGDPDAAHRYLEDLDDVTSVSLRGFLADAMAATPVRAEVTP